MTCVSTSLRSAQSCRTRRAPAANGKLWRSSFCLAWRCDQNYLWLSGVCLCFCSHNCFASEEEGSHGHRFERICSSLFQEQLPVISILCNPGIRDRHWDKMSNIFHRNLKPDTGTTLRKVLQLGLEPYMEQFEQVSAGASKVTASDAEMSVWSTSDR